MKPTFKCAAKLIKFFTPSKDNFHFLPMSEFRLGFTPPNYKFLPEAPNLRVWWS